MSSTSQQFVHIAGWSSCGFYRRATTVLSSLALLFPTRVKIVEHEFSCRTEYRDWLIENKFRDNFPGTKAVSHSSSPFTWFSNSESEKDNIEYLGGCDDTLGWCRTFCSPASNDKKSEEDVAMMVADGHSKDNSYDYDLIVIGGGSGGLAASKEAASLGAKVAVLDFVKPSPMGTKWGLGGTCVNVGCIPKKLMHYGAIVHESMRCDSQHFGIQSKVEKCEWEVMRENIQNFIRGLNFKYRVNLRENDVTYLNKLGRFIDKHTIEVTDKKGNKSTLTSSRFLIAVGGRPTPLSCEGAELAISSDDIFSLEKDPGKVLCVGASYVSLECAGFLSSLGHDTTVAVRSILLRKYDQECASKIKTYMEDCGVVFKKNAVPTRLVKEGESIRVHFSDESSDVYDTVLVAIGRKVDTANLGLENVGVACDEKGAIINEYEQSNVPNIYAVGDVLNNAMEFTPIAIQSGKLLSKRLFGTSRQPFDYKNVCLTVFTPIEYGCVGYTEGEATEKFGKDNIEIYVNNFKPLEWSLSDARATHDAFIKIIVEKLAPNTVLGIHYVGPNAGEVMQGYGVSMKNSGLTFDMLKETVAIHPTSSENILQASVTKSSGKDASADGC